MKTTQWTTRLFSILLCICMMLSVLPAASLSAAAAEYPTITPGVAVTFELNETVTEAIYAFTPEESGVYRFYAYDSSRDTYGYLLDADGNVLAEDDDSANSGNNFLIAHEMTAGTTYLLKARFYTEGAEGTMSMLLEKAAAPTAVTINQGDTYEAYPVTTEQFLYTLEPAGSATVGVTWSVSDPAVIELQEDGYVRFLAPGTATLTVTTAEGLTDTCEVTVLEPLPLKAGETVTATCELHYDVTYSFIPEKTATYAFFTESEKYIPYAELRYTIEKDLMVVGYDKDQQDYAFRIEHELTAGEEYYLYIFGQLLDATFEVTAEEIVPATAMTLNYTTLKGHLGGNVRLRPVYTPTNAIHETITWESSDDTVVSVGENGAARFLKEGTATVTATSENGFTATCEITVGGYPTISLCKTETVSIDVGGNTATYLFTPEESGNYAFYAASEYDTVGYIYDATGETLLYNNDDYLDDRNFRVEATLEAGVTYQLKGEFYYSSQIGPMDLTMVRIDGDGSVIHDVSAYTVTDDGHSGVCDGCGTLVAGTHSYDENGLCVCGDLHIHAGTEYTYDDTEHWYTCVCGETVQEAHMPDADGNCACGYFVHDHEVTEYFYDNDTHWGFCDLCGTNVEASHTLDENNACDCGYFVHDHEGTFGYDAVYHWGDCTVCNQYINVEHTYDEGGNCVCGWFAHAHGGDTYDYDEIEHWLACSQCGIAIGGWEEHSYDEYGECICGDALVYGVYFGNTFIGEGEYLDNNGNITTEMPTGGYAYYENGVLTLHDFTYTGWGSSQAETNCLVYAETELELVLEGNNRLHSLYGDGIYVAGADLTIEGDGTLAIVADGDFDGIDVNDGRLKIESGTLNIDATDHGIEVYGDLRVNGGKITIVAGDDGFDVDGDARFSGGVIDIDAEDNGIDCYEDITINGGEITIHTNDDNGIEAAGDITVNGGFLDINANDECLLAQGGTLTVGGGEFSLNAGGGNAAMMAVTAIVFGEDMGAFDTTTDDSGNTVLADANGDMAQEAVYILTDTTPLKAEWITLSQTKGAFTGEAHTPTVTVVNDNGETLVKDTDYTLAWSAESIKDSGVYTVTVTGIGAYSGTKLKTYTVYDDAVYVGGVLLANGEYLDLNGNVTAETPTGGYAYYADGVLTLSDFVFEGTGYVYNTVDEEAAVVFALHELTIELVGDTAITSEYAGIVTYADLTVGGAGSLTIEGESGILVEKGSLAIDSGKYTVTAVSDAIWAYGDVDIADGNLVLAAGDCDIYADNHVNIRGGNLTLLDAEAGGEDYYYGDGICTDSGDIDIRGGTIAIDTEYGLYSAGGNIYIRGGTVDITGEYGIYADYNDIWIEGGIVTIDADYGIYSYYGIYVEGGAVEVTSMQYAVYADSGITLGDYVAMTIPENGSIEWYENEAYYTVFDENGEIATEVTIKRTYAPGDVNLDGTVNMRDALMLYQYVSGRNNNLTAEQLAAADVSAPGGTVNMRDALLLYQFVSSRITEL